MKNNFFLIAFFIFFKTYSLADNVNISADKITLDKNKNLSIFENNVSIVMENNYKIKSAYAEYNKESGYLLLKNNISAIDEENNVVIAEFAEFNKFDKILKTKGKTKIITSEKYEVNTEDLIIDGNKDYIKSNNETTINDLEGNKIFLKSFEYQKTSNLFKSVGEIKIKDTNNNSFEFSQIYIDTKKKEILGTDAKAFINQIDFKENKDNKPRIFANTVSISKNKKIFDKSVFTTCNYRDEDKCPPWTINASEIEHDNKKKTIYYNNAVLKIYDIPLFYFPKLFHPDPSVKRRSGFLAPTLVSGKNLGTGLAIPYFWDVANDKNFTFTNRIYAKENPLFLGAYHQQFKNSSLKVDSGYTEGFNKGNSKKTSGKKSHFFSELITLFNKTETEETSLKIIFQNTSNDKYLKEYKINSDLVDYEISKLDNAIEFSHSEEDFFIDLNAYVYENLESGYNDKYEYVLPNIMLAKNLLKDDKYGFLDFKTNFKIHNYDTNKYEKYLTNDILWDSNTFNLNNKLNNKFLIHFKNINYEANNAENFKSKPTSELHTALGFESKLELIKSIGSTTHLFTPKTLLRYAPGNMRNDDKNFRLDPEKAFYMDRLNNGDNFETGLSSTLGFDYSIRKKEETKLDFSLAQVINETENKKMPDKSSLNEEMSDLVGSMSASINNDIDFKYKFSIDQNYNEVNYSDYQLGLNFHPLKVDVNYLQEDQHIGNEEYLRTNFKYETNNTLYSFENKRNLITNSSEYYNLSYEYLNDCLRAGLVYRREFYNDSEVEPEDSLMLRITISPIGEINAASITE